MTPILVTGGAGFIGSHTCKALRAAGFDPISYDSLLRGKPGLVIGLICTMTTSSLVE